MEYTEKKRWVFFALPLTFTKYTVTDEQITINAGIVNRTENDCYMYKIQDTVLQTSFFEGVFGLGTVVCKTGDATHPDLVLSHIKKAKEIKDFIVRSSERERMERRTINMQNIGAEAEDGFGAM